jgi:hypothetical protein
MSREQNDRTPKLPASTSQNDIGIQIDYLKRGCEDGTRLGLILEGRIMEEEIYSQGIDESLKRS